MEKALHICLDVDDTKKELKTFVEQYLSCLNISAVFLFVLIISTAKLRYCVVEEARNHLHF